MVRAKRTEKKLDYAQFGGGDDEEEEEAMVLLDETEDEDEDVDMIDEELKPKAKSTKTSKLKKAPKVVSAETQKLVKKEIIRVKDISSIKDKFNRLYGSNTVKQVELVQLRKHWENSVAFFTKDQLAEDESLVTPDVEIPDTIYKAISEQEFNSKFPLISNSIQFQFNNDAISDLNIQDINSNDKTLIINTGSLITDLVWSSVAKDKTQYLIVGISNIKNLNSEKFKLLSRNSYASVIQIYKFNIETKEIKLKTSLLHNWGNLWDLKFLPINDSNGLISAVFNDGNIHIIKLSEFEEEFYEIEKNSIAFSLPNNLITCFDYINDFKLICGTDSGHVAEFSILDGDSPSFIYPLYSSYIFSIASSSKSKFDEILVYSLCSDGNSIVFSLNDINSTINKLTRSKVISKKCIYCPQLYSFLQTEGPYSVKSLPMRSIFAVSSVIKHDGSTECLSSSSLHPFILTGGSDGKIKLTNLSRKLLAAPKQSSNAHKILNLFELQYNGKLFRLINSLEIEKLNSTDNVTSVNIYPSEVTINSINWNNNKISGTLFAASTTSGLIIIHEI